MAREPYPGERPKDWQPPAGAKRGGLSKVVLIVLGVLAALVVIGLLSPQGQKAGDSSRDKASIADAVEGSPPENADSALDVSATELRTAYAANEVAAQARFGGAPLRVTGTIADITLDFMNEPVLVLESGDDFNRVQADFDKVDASAIAALNKGAAVALRCEKVSEVLGSPMLDDCALE